MPIDTELEKAVRKTFIKNRIDLDGMGEIFDRSRRIEAHAILASRDIDARLQPAVINLDITERDIDDGQPGDGNLCPIALSLRRYFGGTKKRIEVTESMAHIDGFMYELDGNSLEFIKLFDNGEYHDGTFAAQLTFFGQHIG